MNLGVFVPEWEQWIKDRDASSSNIMDKGIEELDLSVRSFNCLKRFGVDTARDIMSFTDDADLMRVRNMGKDN